VYCFFKLIEYLTYRISIKDYEYNGSDLLGGDAKVIWLFSGNNRNINGVKYANDKFYFKVYTQSFKVGMSKVIDIDTKKEETYDYSTIVIFNKNEMGLITRCKLIGWLISEFIKNKIEPNRSKILPKFLIEPYVFTDSIYLNMDNIYKYFNNKKLIIQLIQIKQQKQ
jgi:hypothetical protein